MPTERELLAANIRLQLGDYNDDAKPVSECVCSLLATLTAKDAEIEQVRESNTQICELLEAEQATTELLRREVGELKTELSALRASFEKARTHADTLEHEVQAIRASMEGKVLCDAEPVAYRYQSTVGGPWTLAHKPGHMSVYDANHGVVAKPLYAPTEE